MNIESKLDKSQSQLTKSTPHVVNVARKESKLGKSEIKTLQRPFLTATARDLRITIPSLILLPHGISGSPSRL
jgi:hypothetical protein